MTCLLVVACAANVARAEPAELPGEVRKALAALGDGVVGPAIPARPIDDPASLRHLEPGTWRYRIVGGANRGQEQTVRVERAGEASAEGAWRVVTDGSEIQKLRVTTDHEIVKTEQTDVKTDRVVRYRPGLVLEPGLQRGETRRASARIATYKIDRPEEVEYDGEVEYAVTYLGANRVTTPAGTFDARLLEHRYEMKIGPAKAKHRSFGFYAAGVGNVAEVSEESVSALLVYRRSKESARVLLEAPESSTPPGP